MIGETAVVFDLDGPILDASRRYRAVFAETVARLGGRNDALDDWSMRRNGLGRRERLAAAGILDRVDDFSRLWLERIEAPDMLALDRPQPGIEVILDRLSEGFGLPVLVTFRRDGAALENQLKVLDLMTRFGGIASGPAPNDGKAAAKAALAARLGRKAGTPGWFIGDTPTDIVAARYLGLWACAVGYGLTGPQRLAANGPDRLCGTPDDLVSWVGEILAAQRDMPT